MEKKDIKIAWELKREKGVSWTKLPGALQEAIGGDLHSTNTIRDAIRCYEKSNGLTAKKKDLGLVLSINDVHIGKRTASYNSKKIIAKMEHVFNDFLNDINMQKRIYNINILHINFIGDILDNDSLYPTQPHHVDRETGEVSNPTKQVEFADELFSRLISELYKKTRIPIDVNCVKGNHGRISKFTDEGNNYDVMFYNSLKKSFKEHKKINCYVTDSFYMIKNINGHGFLLHHGNGIKMYQNIPWYGLVQKCMRWAGSLSQEFKYMIVGHFHTSGEQVWNDKTIFMNGTPVEEDIFPLEVLGLSADNTFWVFGVTKNDGIKYRNKINMSEV